MGHVEVSHLTYALPDGRVLLDDVSFRVGDGARAGLVGANGAGKTTLMQMVAGDLAPSGGSVASSGGLGVMPQFIGSLRDDSTVHDLLLSLSPSRVRAAAAKLEASELAMMDVDDESTQLRYAHALADWADCGGYEFEVLWDTCTTEALGQSFTAVRWRPVRTLSGGEQKRLALEALLRGPDAVLLLDEPDNYLDVPAKRWLEERLLDSPKTILYVTHDRELLARTATHIVTVELGAAGNTAWVHGGGFSTYSEARADRFSRSEELRRRWDEEHNKLKRLVATLRQKASYNDGMASRYQAAVTRLTRFELAGPPQAVPRRQSVRMLLKGGRTGKRAVVCERLELTGLLQPFDIEVWFGERVAVVGGNGSGKSHFLRLLAAGGSDPDIERRPVGDLVIPPVAHRGNARLGARVRPGWFAQMHEHPELLGRTLNDILWKGDEHRAGMDRETAARALDRYELAVAAEQVFESLSGGQQARLQILLLELSGATLLLLDEPTDNLDLVSAEALEAGLAAFEGTVLAVTHDRWFARGFDRFLIFREDGGVTAADEPVWDEDRAVPT